MVDDIVLREALIELIEQAADVPCRLAVIRYAESKESLRYPAMALERDWIEHFP